MKKRIKKLGLKGSLEPKISKQIDKLVKGTRIVKKYETDRLPYFLLKNYVPDFPIVFPDGRTMYLEVKGWLRPSDRTKMIAVKKNNPQADIRFVFGKDNKLHKSSKTTYSEWAIKNGFQYAIGEVPKEWFSQRQGEGVPPKADRPQAPKRTPVRRRRSGHGTHVQSKPVNTTTTGNTSIS